MARFPAGAVVFEVVETWPNAIVSVGDVVEGCGLDSTLLKKGVPDNCVVAWWGVTDMTPDGLVYLEPKFVRPLTRSARAMLALVEPCTNCGSVARGSCDDCAPEAATCEGSEL